MKSWPSEDFSFGQCGGPRGGSSKTAPKPAFPSDVETHSHGQHHAKLCLSKAKLSAALEDVIGTIWILAVISVVKTKPELERMR